MLYFICRIQYIISSFDLSGAVGNPFPDVQVAIGKPDMNNPNEYAILATGNSSQTSVSNGNF